MSLPGTNNSEHFQYEHRFASPSFPLHVDSLILFLGYALDCQFFRRQTRHPAGCNLFYCSGYIHKVPGFSESSQRCIGCNLKDHISAQKIEIHVSR